MQRRLSEQVSPKQLAVSEARYKAALAQVKQRQADLDQAKLNLGYTIIKAPVDGVVSRKNAEPGMQVSPGQQITALVPLRRCLGHGEFQRDPAQKDARRPECAN